MKVLIVDDNIDLANGLRDILATEDHDVSVYYNAEDTLQSYNETDFDIAFIDIKLPDMNGLELFGKIHEKYPDTHIYVISGYRINQIIEESTGISNTAIINGHVSKQELDHFINQLDETPLTLALADTYDYTSWLTDELKTRGKTPLLIDYALIADSNMDNYDSLLIHTSRSLIYDLIDFVKIRKSGIKKPVIIASGRSVSEQKQNKLQSLQLTGCLFKPFKPDELINIIHSAQNSFNPDSRRDKIRGFQ